MPKRRAIDEESLASGRSIQCAMDAAVTAAERAACRGFEDEHGCVEDELPTMPTSSGSSVYNLRAPFF